MVFFLSTNLYSIGRLLTRSDPLSGRFILCFVEPEKGRCAVTRWTVRELLVSSVAASMAAGSRS
jgi:hypothetical protein